MKKSTSVSKQVNGLYNAEYAQLLTKVAEYRTNLRASASGKSAKDPFKTYGRIFTEPRVNGLRSKYWICSSEATAVIQKYVKKNPTITIGKSIYSVTAYSSKGSDMRFSRSCYNSTSITVKKVK